MDAQRVNSSAQSSRALGTWRALWEQEAPRLFLFARQQTRCEADAQDVLQEAFLRVWNSRNERPPSAQRLFHAIRFAALDQGRSQTRRSRREEIAGQQEQVERDTAVWFDCPVEAREQRKEIGDALRELPDEQQEVLVLKVWGDLTFAEIGEVLDLSPNTASSRYRYGLKALKSILNPALA